MNIKLQPEEVKNVTDIALKIIYFLFGDPKKIRSNIDFSTRFHL
ncbi:hypothetical protein LEP1GSC115_1087 [Leptospira interrogans serovar Australis str. 200703203]|uniref:Uncharacterized protein n=1 Tax=Leptospira interrogans serovar Australis str. 200703203 TaxID=1085541 RepID=N1UF47_LEPIR|nr:hypothetical protein LEP1GSC115_1087 [Leptospira interrogans serovar Australis str. 200703203]